MEGAGQILTIPVTRGANGALGIGLNESNRVTEVGAQGASGLKSWDMVVAVDDVAVGERTLAQTLGAIPNKATHELTIMRMASAPPIGDGAGVMTAELEKQSPAFGHPWQKRTFQLERAGDTLWYRTGEDKPKGIALKSVFSIRVADHKANEVHLKTNDSDRVFKIRAPDNATLFQWVTALQTRHGELNPERAVEKGAVAADL